MPGRTVDTQDKIDELGELMKRGSAEALLAATERALVALDFRASDAMIGLEEVDDELVNELDERVGAALIRASELGSDEATTRLAERAVHRRDPTLAAAARARLEAVGGRESSGRASYAHALLCFHGIGGDTDLERCVLLHRDAAAKGNAEAMFELYAMLSRGLGGAADPNQAIAYCRMAAEAGHPRAMYNLGAFHATGNGAPFDEGESVRWYTRAAENGHARAAATLGLMRWTGQGAPRDREDGFAWLARATDLGFDWHPMAHAMGVDPRKLGGGAKPAVKKAAPKKAAAKKKPAKKPAAKKAASKKGAAKKGPAKKPAAQKAAPKKAAAKKKPAKKPTAKKAKKPAAKKKPRKKAKRASSRS